MMYGEDVIEINSLVDLQRQWPTRKIALGELLLEELVEVIYLRRNPPETFANKYVKIYRV